MRTKPFVCYDEAAETLITLLNEAGHPAYSVGGCVRDTLLGLTPHDYDIATNALPEETKALFQANGYPVIETGLRHGTVSVIVSGKPYEITTFRTDGEYRDHRRPEQVTFVRTLREDLARRDFTINALAFGREAGLIDYFGGRQDLERGILRCVGDPATRFEEDALRILRALRFASVFDFTIAEETAAAIHSCRALLGEISAERICAELLRLLTGRRPAQIIREYIDVFGVFLPELLPCVGFRQNNPFHIYDLFEHTLVALAQSPPEVTVRLAVLLHDIGKPYTYLQDDVGVGHFKGHAALGAELAAKILNRLKCSRTLREDVCLLIRHHDDRPPAALPALKRLLRKQGAENAIRLMQVERADHAAQNPQRVAARMRELEQAEHMLRELIASETACIAISDLAVTGADLLAAGIPQGRQIGAMLELLLEAVTEETLPNEREALLNFVAAEKDSL